MSATSDLELLKPRHPLKRAKRNEPAWDIALLHPLQGQWCEEEYLSLGTSWMVELVNGYVEVLPMPSPFHQLIVIYLLEQLKAFVAKHGGGDVLTAPMPIRLWHGRLREPDLAYFKPKRMKNRHETPEGADLTMEVVSEGEESRERDLIIKRREYAKARIPEYWIVDPEEERITVLVLEKGSKTYRVHGKFKPGEQATSVLLRGFAVDVTAVFAAGGAK